jgi:hypothetical protein
MSDIETKDLMPKLATNGVSRVDIGDDETWEADPFGWHTYINIVGNKRIDGFPVLAVSWVRSEDNAPGSPVVIGTARALYKQLAKFGLAPDHLAYICYELGKADICALNNLPYEMS